MPYIKKRRRGEIPKPVRVDNCGELNFQISRLLHDYIKSKELCYSTLNEVIGVLECAKLEAYRTIASPYEDKKAKENGSVSDLDKPFFEG